MNATAKRAEADKCMKKAIKAYQPSLTNFRLKPDWEEACPLFEKAAVVYRQIGQLEKSIEAYEKAAQAQEKLGSPWHAAKHMETCGTISKELGAWPKVTEFYRAASELYVEAGRTAEGADALAKGAKLVEASSPGEATNMYKEAVTLYETDGKQAQASDLFRQAIAMLIRSQKHSEAVSMLLRFGEACDSGNARSSQCKAYLGAVVVWLYAENPKEAWQVFQDCLDVSVFSGSEEAFAADALFTSYQAGHAAKVKELVASKAAFKYLDPQVARVALKLPTGDMEFMSRSITALMGGQNPDASEPNSEDEVL